MADPKRSRVPVKLEAAGDTHIGGRTHNEDAILLRPDLNLYLVADGAGGQNAGNVASSLAITTIAHFFEITQDGAAKMPEYDALGLATSARRLSAAVQEANDEIIAISKTSDKHKGMGTTIVAALFDVAHRMLHVGYVGDSRCYRLRGDRMELLSFDHSLINDVLELRPNIDDARVKKLPKNVITRALGMSDNLRVSIRSHELVHGDRYLLCSDGLSDVVDDAQIAEALAMDVPCDEQVALLMGMALDGGAVDNIACVIVDCSLPQGSSKTSTRPMRKSFKKASHSKLPREDSPEIVLYDQIPPQRDSSPLVHVVPAKASSDAVVDAVHDVMAGDGEPKAVASQPPPGIFDSHPDESDRAGRYAIIDEQAAGHGKAQGDGATSPLGLSELSSSAGKSRKQAKPQGATRPGGSIGGPVNRPTDPRRAESKRSLSAPRINKIDVEADGGATRGGQTESPLGGDSAIVETVPGPPSSPPLAGKTRRPSALSPLPHDAPSRATIPGTAPPLPQKPMPPMREPFDTSEFTGDDSIPCHACGSVISKRAEICMYCGATTGFVMKR